MNYRSLIFRGLWLACFASADGYCERVVVCRTRRQPSAALSCGDEWFCSTQQLTTESIAGCLRMVFSDVLPLRVEH
jgi:hypothetical protein